MSVTVSIPKAKRPVKIVDFDPDQRRIRFEAVGWVAGQIVYRKMGRLRTYPSGYCVLTVNDLYEFEDVYDWLQSLEHSQQAA